MFQPSSQGDQSIASFVSAPDDKHLVGEDNFRHLAEALPQIVWTSTPKGQIDYFSPQWGYFSGLSQDDPDYLNWMVRVHPDDMEETLATCREALRARRAYEQEFRLMSHDGTYYWFSSRGIPVKNKRGSTVKWYGTVTDIDQHKKDQHNLVQHTREKDRFIAMLGHELRNPLAAITSGYEVLKREHFESENTQSIVDLIGKQLSHLNRLVDDTLDISRLTSGKLPLSLAPLELSSLIGECTATLIERASQKGIKIDISSAQPEFWISGDEVRINQCLTNLISNAIKFTQPNGEIFVSLKSDEDKIDLSVRDSGIGISKEDMSQIFTPFIQGDCPTQLCSEGIGLGLSVAKVIAELHKGSISVSSPGPGAGSTFTITLPAAETQGTQQTSSEEVTVETSSHHILIIEDNESVSFALQLFLELDGHTVRVAPDGETGLRLIDENIPDILISDITLPGVHQGWDIAAEVMKKHPEQTRPYLIALSGHALPHHIEKSMQSGFQEHLAKPPSTEQLRQSILTAANYLKLR